MDNQNNSNLPNPNPTSPFGAPPQPLPDQDNLPPQTPPSPPPPPPLPTPGWPPPSPASPPDPWSPTPQPEPAPWPSNPLPADPMQSQTPTAWPTTDASQQSAPVTSEPAIAQPFSNTLPPQDQIPTWTPPAQTPQPEPTSSPALSPLDNPWQAPSQPPSIDGSGATIQPTIQPSWAAIPNTPIPPTPAESAPTDLSHLINSSQEAPQPPPETLVVPSAITPNPEVSTLTTEKHKGIPKWIIGLGIGLLILVIGATAYLILGIGQPTKTTSLPAEVKPSAPVAAPTSQPSKQPIASGAANFGELGGGGSGETPATSAAELLRQRQQGR